MTNLLQSANGKTHREDRAQDTRDAARWPHRWAIVLAGGDGVRLRGLTRMICGDDRPKQFCPLLGEGTLLELARQRAERSIRPQQTLFAVTKAHQDYYLPDLGRRLCQRIVQPCNRGTAPPILYSLLHIAESDADATVSVLPCDHYYSDEGAFTQALESAFEIAKEQPRSVVLLGAQPSAPEIEYGWIELGAAVREDLLQVRAFHEKPARPLAECLLRAGALWNTFVMVGHINAFLEMAWAAAPGLLEVFQSTLGDARCATETRISDALYDWVAPLDFSRHILSAEVQRLVALRLANVEWHDLGNPGRVWSALLARKGELPPWVKRWQAVKKGMGRGSARRPRVAVA